MNVSMHNVSYFSTAVFQIGNGKVYEYKTPDFPINFLSLCAVGNTDVL